MNTTRKYDRSFKDRAAKLSYERSSITDLATELGVLPDRIYSWRKEFADYLDRQFVVDAPCKVWVSDITYIHTTHGFRY